MRGRDGLSQGQDKDQDDHERVLQVPSQLKVGRSTHFKIKGPFLGLARSALFFMSFLTTHFCSPFLIQKVIRTVSLFFFFFDHPWRQVHPQLGDFGYFLRHGYQHCGGDLEGPAPRGVSRRGRVLGESSPFVKKHSFGSYLIATPDSFLKVLVVSIFFTLEVWGQSF